MSRTAEPTERRGQILRAAVAVFSERGYANATISDIASAAGVAHGTIYLYFRSKAEIFDSLVNWFSEHIVEGVTAMADADETRSTDLRTTLFQLTYCILAASAAYPKLADVCLRPVNDTLPDLVQPLRRVAAVLTESIAECLATAIRRGEVRPIDPYEGADLILSTIGVAIERLLRRGSAVDLDHLSTWYVDFLLYGLSGTPSRNLVECSIVPLRGNL